MTIRGKSKKVRTQNHMKNNDAGHRNCTDIELPPADFEYFFWESER